jgi:uncharacterized alkaline shock family protein YloU
MNIFFRIILATYGFCLTVISFISMIITLKPELFQSTTEYVLQRILQDSTYTVILFLLEFVFFSFSVVFLLSGVKSQKDHKSIVKFNNVGEIRISIDSLESIAFNTARKLNGVKDAKAYVTKIGDAINVSIKVSILPEVNIPLLLEDMQKKVKKSIEETSGVMVNEVKVSADTIYTGYKSRVE